MSEHRTVAERQNEAGDTEILLRRVVDLVNAAPKMPLSSTVRLEKDELLELLHEAIQRLPDELRQARWLLREREEYLAKVSREGEDILAAARERAERIVQRTELVREAQRLSRRLLEDANEEARRLRHEAEDYCDQKLATFEIVLERTMKTVQAGREKLRVTPLPPAQEGELGGPPPSSPAAGGPGPGAGAAGPGPGGGHGSRPGPGPSPNSDAEPPSGEVFFDQDLS